MVVSRLSCLANVLAVLPWKNARRFDTSRGMNAQTRIVNRLVLAFLAVAVTFVGNEMFSRPAAAQSRQQVTFRQQLRYGLRARTAEEVAYLESIVQLVESGALPQRTVNIAFLWSRKKNARFPYPYFSRAVFILAERDGIAIPRGPYFPSF